MVIDHPDTIGIGDPAMMVHCINDPGTASGVTSDTESRQFAIRRISNGFLDPPRRHRLPACASMKW